MRQIIEIYDRLLPKIEIAQMTDIKSYRRLMMVYERLVEYIDERKC